jgi:hypothetical protein
VVIQVYGTPRFALKAGASNDRTMKISRLSSEIKVLSLLLWVASGCAPMVAEAPFSARTDTVEPGDLVGPFDGRVLDASSGKPIAGAVVFATWGFEVGHGLTAPGGATTASTETNSDGRYTIPKLPELPGGRARLMRFTLIIYKRGFVAYRSDRRFDDNGVRRDFAQHNNVARLDRFAQGTSHVRHVSFVGGGGPLRRALSAEVIEAGLELGGVGPVAPGPAGPPLDAAPLLSVDELRAVTGYEGELTVEKLADLPTTASYDSRHFRAKDKPESFDAAIRVWKLPTTAAAEARYDAVFKAVPHVEARDEVGDRSLRGVDGKILAAATLDKEHNVVIQLTCGADQCRDADQTVALLRRILSRADRLGVEKTEPEEKPTEAKPEEETPAPKEPAEENQFQLRPRGLRK